MGRDDDGYRLWTYDRTRGGRPWQSAGIAGVAPPSPIYLFDEAGQRFLAVSFTAAFSDTLPPVSEAAVWSLFVSGAPRWERLDATGTPPTGRRNPALAIDAAGRRLLFVGGEEVFSNGPSEPYRGDLWQLRLDPPVAWERVSLAGPDLAGGVGWDAFYDTDRQRLSLVGGFDTLSVHPEPRRIRAVDLAGARTWFEPAGSDTSRIGDSGTSLYVPELGTYFILQRSPYFMPPDSTYLHVLDVAGGGGWSRRNFTTIPRPGVAAAAELAYDPTTSRVQYVGGEGTHDSIPLPSIQHADVWSFPAGVALPTWRRDYSSVDEGQIRGPGPMVLDAGRRLVYAIPRFNEGLYAYRLDDPNGWEYLPRTTQRPSRREGAVAVFDPHGDRVIQFGGGDGDVEFGDLWECRLFGPWVRWTRRVPEGDAPLPRIHASAVYDPVRHRMVLFGGFGGRPLDDAWQLDLADSIPRWSRIPVRGAPPPARWGQSAVYDSLRDAMIVFGGAAGDIENPQPMRDAWILSFIDGDAWLPLSPEGNPPLGRFRHSAVLDPVGGRMIVLWGRDASGGRFDTASLEFGPPARWTSFSPQGVAPLGREGAALFYDSVNDRAIALGGRGVSGFGGDLSDAWAIDWSRVDRSPPPPTAGGEAFVLLAVGPNPATSEVNIAFELPRRTTVHLRLYDVRGRMVRDLGARSYHSGRHILNWDGRSASGERMRDGVYFARIVVEGKAISGKIVLMN